jgi:hypothetical protein
MQQPDYSTIVTRVTSMLATVFVTSMLPTLSMSWMPQGATLRVLNALNMRLRNTAGQLSREGRVRHVRWVREKDTHGTSLVDDVGHGLRLGMLLAKRDAKCIQRSSRRQIRSLMRRYKVRRVHWCQTSDCSRAFILNSEGPPT